MSPTYPLVGFEDLETADPWPLQLSPRENLHRVLHSAKEPQAWATSGSFFWNSMEFPFPPELGVTA